uniref:Enamelin n=1 Tax=Globodera pallida TaxID=36090 RepID=A0A183C7Z7_GLOPA
MYHKSHRIGSKTFLLLLALITFNAILLIKAQDESDEGGGEGAGGDDASPEGGGDTDGEGSADNAEEHNNNNESAGEGESGQNEEHQQEGSEEEPDQQQHSNDEESAEHEGEGGGRGAGKGGGKKGAGGGKGGAGGGKGGTGGGKGGAVGGKGTGGGGRGIVPGAGAGTAGQPNTAGQPGQLPGGQPANPIPPGGVQPQTGGIQPTQLPGGGQQLPSPSYPSPYPSSNAGQYPSYPSSNAGQYPSYPAGGQGQQPSPSSFYPNPAYPSSSSDTYYPPNPSPYYPNTRQPYEPYEPTYESGGGGFRQNRPLDDRDFFDNNFGFGSASGVDRSLPSVINGDNFDPGHPQGRLMAGATFVAPEEQSHLPPVHYGARFKRFAARGEMPANPYAFLDPKSAGHKRDPNRRNGGRRTKRRTMLCFVPSPGTRQNGNMDFWRYNLLKYSPNQFQRHFPYRTNGEIHGQEGAWGRRKRRQMDFPEGSGSFPEYRRRTNYGGYDNGGHGGGGNNPSLICQPIDDNGYGGGGERGAPISQPIGRGGHLPRRDDHY